MRQLKKEEIVKGLPKTTFYPRMRNADKKFDKVDLETSLDAYLEGDVEELTKLNEKGIKVGGKSKLQVKKERKEKKITAKQNLRTQRTQRTQSTQMTQPTQSPQHMLMARIPNLTRRDKTVKIVEKYPHTITKSKTKTPKSKYDPKNDPMMDAFRSDDPPSTTKGVDFEEESFL